MRNRPTAKLYAIAAILILIGIALPVSAAHSFSLLSAQSVGYTEPSEYLTEINSNRGRSNYGKNRKESRQGRAAKNFHRDSIIKKFREKHNAVQKLGNKKNTIFYECQNYGKFISEILSSNPSHWAKNKYLRKGLIAHEGGRIGGHTIERHVGLSNKGLKDRYANDKTLIRRDGSKTKNISTFHSLRKAEHFVERAIQEKMKTEQGRREMKEFLEGRGDTPGKLRWDHVFTGETTGVSLHGPSGNISNVNGVRIILKRNKNHPNGWQVLTAYPQKG